MDWKMSMDIDLEFPNYIAVVKLTELMAQSDWFWEYSVYCSGGDRATIKITGITCYQSLNDFRKMVGKVMEGK